MSSPSASVTVVTGPNWPPASSSVPPPSLLWPPLHCGDVPVLTLLFQALSVAPGTARQAGLHELILGVLASPTRSPALCSLTGGYLPSSSGPWPLGALCFCLCLCLCLCLGCRFLPGVGPCARCRKCISQPPLWCWQAALSKINGLAPRGMYRLGEKTDVKLVITAIIT